MPLDFEFSAVVWLYDGPVGWYFVTLPYDVSARIHSLAAGKWGPGGSLGVTAMIGLTRWKTSIFRDRKREAYLLPLKAPVRAKEQLRAGDPVAVTLLMELHADD